MQFEDLQSRLKAKPSGKDYSARCPAHDDTRNSLKLKRGEKRSFLDCYAKCTEAEICAALGLSEKDLFFDSPKGFHQNGKMPNTSTPKPTKPKRLETSRTEVSAYDYRDEQGNLIYQNVRFLVTFNDGTTDKDFRPRHFNAEGKAVWSLQGVRRVPYRLPELVAALAKNPRRFVLAAEGEKDVTALIENGFVATNFKNWRAEFNQYISGANVVLLCDHDRAGIRQADEAAKIIESAAASLRIVDLFADERLPEKHGRDVSDWLADGHTADELGKIIKQSPLVSANDKPNTKSNSAPKDEPRKSQATRLMELTQDLKFFHTPSEECFAIVQVENHFENLRLNTKAFRAWLSRRFYEADNQTPNAQSLQDVINTLSGKALFDGECLETYIRVAEHDDAIFIDLCDANWRAVQITANGWKVIESAAVPIKFRRSRGMLPLPMPEPGGSLDALQNLINLQKEDFVLVAAWLVATLRPNKPFPCLGMYGEQGSAKSTAQRVLRSLIDPNQSPLRSRPRDERDLMIAANNSWIVAFDNLSGISADLSDNLCKLATGAGFSTRELYSNDDEILFNSKRPILFNGIEELANRPDLLDRSLILNLPRISEENRKTEAEFWRDFEATKPKIIGALFDKVAAALAKLPTVKLNKKPRMADFAEFAFAAFGDDFLKRYEQSRASANESALEASPVALAVRQLMENHTEWEGTSSELLKRFETLIDEKERNRKEFPKQPNALSGKLKRIAPNLRTIGINYEQTGDKNGGRGGRTFKLTKAALEKEQETSLPSLSPLQINKNGAESVTMSENRIVTGNQKIVTDSRCNDACNDAEKTSLPLKSNKNGHCNDDNDDNDTLSVFSKSPEEREEFEV